MDDRVPLLEPAATVEVVLSASRSRTRADNAVQAARGLPLSADSTPADGARNTLAN